MLWPKSSRPSPLHVRSPCGGMDPLGPFKKALGGLPHMLVAIDKFTKWIKVRPLAKIGSMQAVKFIHDIIFHCGVPNSIITDNDTQYTR
jgi:hypothetical protein